MWGQATRSTGSIAKLTIAVPVLLALCGPAAAAGTLERIKETGVFKIGFRADVRPFSYRNDAGEADGYSVALCRLIGRQIQDELKLAALKIEYVVVTPEERFKDVAAGRVDLLCGSATATLARRETVSFSLPIFITGVSALMRGDAPPFLRAAFSAPQAGSPPRSVIQEALKGRHFGAVRGTTAETWLQKNLRDLATDSEIVLVDGYKAGLDQVTEGRIDAFFADQALILGALVQDDSPLGFLMSERMFTYEPYALALQRGDEDFRLLVDRTLSALYRSGEIAPVLAQHLGKAGQVQLQLFPFFSLPE